jgi:hypothetical protein
MIGMEALKFTPCISLQSNAGGNSNAQAEPAAEVRRK